ncbi:MAG: HAD family hydrolase [Lachnospiraceae bacterium]
MIQAILFDMDGTLYDEVYPKVRAELLTSEYISEKTQVGVCEIYDTFRQVKSFFTKSYSSAQLKNNRKLWFEETLRKLDISGITGEEASEYYWNMLLQQMGPYIDFLHVLPWFQANFELFVLTDESIEICKRKLERLGLENEFKAVISSEQVGKTKPSKELFDFALSITGYTPEEIVMVGDNPSADILGGNMAGMSTAWLKRGKYHYYPFTKRETPDYVFTGFLQLYNWIKS